MPLLREDITPAALKAARKVLATPVAKWTPAGAAKHRRAAMLVQVNDDPNSMDAFLSSWAYDPPKTFAEHDEMMYQCRYRQDLTALRRPEIAIKPITADTRTVVVQTITGPESTVVACAMEDF